MRNIPTYVPLLQNKFLSQELFDLPATKRRISLWRPKALAIRATSPALSTMQATTIHDMDSTPYRIFKISELTRLIAIQLVLISQKSAVNLACACRSLEEPVLSTLWEIQSSLYALLEVLPQETLVFKRPIYNPHTVCGLDPPLEGLEA